MYLDSSVIFDFSNPEEEHIFNVLEHFITLCTVHSIFATTEYIWDYELLDIKKEYRNKLEKLLTIDSVPEEFYLVLPPSNIDLGEWSIYWAIQKKSCNCCVLCNDRKARKFFQTKKLLPCQHFKPEVGGTLGILDFMESKKLLPLAK